MSKTICKCHKLAPNAKQLGVRTFTCDHMNAQNLRRFMRSHPSSNWRIKKLVEDFSHFTLLRRTRKMLRRANVRWVVSNSYTKTDLALLIFNVNWLASRSRLACEIAKSWKPINAHFVVLGIPEDLVQLIRLFCGPVKDKRPLPSYCYYSEPSLIFDNLELQ